MSRDYEKPLYKRGDEFYKGKFRYKILGVEKVIADYRTGRQGVCYRVKDNKNKYEYSVPCWKLEKDNKDFGYHKKRKTVKKKVDEKPKFKIDSNYYKYLYY